MNILIVFWAGLGNTILLIPTLKGIRSLFPQGKIHMLIKKKIVQHLLDGSGLVDRYILYHKSNRLKDFGEQLKIAWQLKAKKYDRIITVSNHYKSAFLTSIIPGEMKIGYASGNWWDKVYDVAVKFDSSIHEVDLNLNLVQTLGALPSIERRPEIYVGDREKKFAQEAMEKIKGKYNTPIIGIHPGCSEALINKRWYADRFAKVADILSERYKAQIVIFGGKNEIGLSNKIAQMLDKANPLFLTGKTSIKETTATIGKCDLFISNDSGLMHVASAMKVPVVAIFGPTNVEKNAPLGKHNVIVRKDTACAPCSNYRKGGCDDTICLDRITVSDVIRAVEEILGGREPEKRSR